MDDVTENDWQLILNVKETVNKAYEIARTDKTYQCQFISRVTVYAMADNTGITQSIRR